MAFHTFDVTELPEESDDDYAIEITTKAAKLGVTLSEEEAQGIGHALLDSVDGEMENFDGKNVSEI